MENSVCINASVWLITLMGHKNWFTNVLIKSLDSLTQVVCVWELVLVLYPHVTTHTLLLTSPKMLKVLFIHWTQRAESDILFSVPNSPVLPNLTLFFFLQATHAQGREKGSDTQPAGRMSSGCTKL